MNESVASSHCHHKQPGENLISAERLWNRSVLCRIWLARTHERALDKISLNSMACRYHTHSCAHCNENYAFQRKPLFSWRHAHSRPAINFVAKSRRTFQKSSRVIFGNAKPIHQPFRRIDAISRTCNQLKTENRFVFVCFLFRFSAQRRYQRFLQMKFGSWTHGAPHPTQAWVFFFFLFICFLLLWPTKHTIMRTITCSMRYPVDAEWPE